MANPTSVPIIFPIHDMALKTLETPEELAQWEDLMRAGVGIVPQISPDVTVACSLTKGDGGSNIDDPCSYIASLGLPDDDSKAEPLRPILLLQPLRYRVLSTPEELQKWEEVLARKMGLSPRTDGSYTATETQSRWNPDGGPNDDCDVGSDGDLATLGL